MTEPKKIAIVFLVLMVLGTLALAVEWFRMKVNGWLVLVIVSLVLLMMALSIHHARAHDADHPELHPWYGSLMQPDNPSASCCGTADAYWCDLVSVRHDGPNKEPRTYCKITDGRADGPLGRPHVPIGTEVYIPNHKLKWDAGNPTGHAVVFMRGPETVFCFVQGGGV